MQRDVILNSLHYHLTLCLRHNNSNPSSCIITYGKILFSIKFSALKNNSSIPFNQSDLKALHSTKTATHKLTNDLLAASVEDCSILIPLDLSTSFDTSDCSILLDKKWADTMGPAFIHKSLRSLSFSVVLVNTFSFLLLTSQVFTKVWF